VVADLGRPRRDPSRLGWLTQEVRATVTPSLVINRPVRATLNINNCGVRVFGAARERDDRPGRPRRVAAIGAAQPGMTSMSTFAHPGRQSVTKRLLIRRA